jgi:adenine-specific DNA-methyltransferase
MGGLPVAIRFAEKIPPVSGDDSPEQMTPYHSQYWAQLLTLKGAGGSIENLSRSLSNARVDLNPHQVDAALFALRSPLSKGAILADEVS